MRNLRVCVYEYIPTKNLQAADKANAMKATNFSLLAFFGGVGGLSENYISAATDSFISEPKTKYQLSIQVNNDVASSSPNDNEMLSNITPRRLETTTSTEQQRTVNALLSKKALHLLGGSGGWRPRSACAAEERMIPKSLECCSNNNDISSMFASAAKGTGFNVIRAGASRKTKRKESQVSAVDIDNGDEGGCKIEKEEEEFLTENELATTTTITATSIENKATQVTLQEEKLNGDVDTVVQTTKKKRSRSISLDESERRWAGGRGDSNNDQKYKRRGSNGEWKNHPALTKTDLVLASIIRSFNSILLWTVT